MIHNCDGSVCGRERCSCTDCPGSGQLARPGMGRPICPVCHHTNGAGMRGKWRKGMVVPEHEAQKG